MSDSIDESPKLELCTMNDDALGRITYGMQVTGHHKWGFVIYRCTSYSEGEQGHWQSYLALLQEQAGQSLEINGRQRLLEPYLQWTVMEDPVSLRRASKDEVRRRFREWLGGRSVARDGAGVDYPRVDVFLPRYRYCLFVDDDCLQSLERGDTTRIVVIDSSWEADLHADGDADSDDSDLPSEDRDTVIVNGEIERRGAYPPVDGCTQSDVGWMFTETLFLVELYNDLAFEPTWRLSYKRPPAVY